MEMSKQLRVLHLCESLNEEAQEIFYCSGITGDEIEDEDNIYWCVHEDNRNNKGNINTVSWIDYCPFCGRKLELTIKEAMIKTKSCLVEEIK